MSVAIKPVYIGSRVVPRQIVVGLTGLLVGTVGAAFIFIGLLRHEGGYVLLASVLVGAYGLLCWFVFRLVEVQLSEKGIHITSLFRDEWQQLSAYDRIIVDKNWPVLEQRLIIFRGGQRYRFLDSKRGIFLDETQACAALHQRVLALVERQSKLI